MINHAILSFTFVAAIGCGLVGGIFFAFSTFVMAALGRLPSDHGRIVQVLPVASAVIITVLGLLLTARSLPGVM